MNRILIATMVTAGLTSPVALAQSQAPAKPTPPSATAGQSAAGQSAAGQTARQSAAQSNTGMPARIQLTSANRIAGQTVVDRMGQEVGEVEYLMIDAQSGEVRYALIGSGGVFDIGEDVTPVPWSELTVVPGELYGAVTIDTDLEQLRQGQRFTREDIQRLTEPALVTQIVNFYAKPDIDQASGSTSPQASGTGSAAAGDQNQAGQGRQAQNQQGQGQPGQGQQAQNQQTQGHPAILVGREYVTVLAPPALMSPDEIRGATVTAANGEDIGDIDRVMIDTRRGQVPYVLIGRGGFLGMGEEWVPVPYRALSWSAGGEGFVLNANEQQLKRMQSLPKQDLPAQVRTSDLKKLYDSFGVAPYWQQKQG